MNDSLPSSLPLEGTRVIDLTTNVSGPFGTLILADLGAEVIKLEKPPQGDDTRHYAPLHNGLSLSFEALNRNKKSIALDLSRVEGRDLAIELIRSADVLVENMRPGKMEQLGIGPDQLKGTVDSLIYCSISGYGKTGPMSDAPGYDMLIQGRTGIMDLTGEADGPPVRVGTSIVDISTGMWAAINILTALLDASRREPDRSIHQIDISLFDSGIAWMMLPLTFYTSTGQSPKRMGGQTPLAAPADIYPTTNGYITLAILNDTMWREFRSIVGVEALDDEKFLTNPRRSVQRDELTQHLKSLFERESTEHWLNLLRPAGITIERVAGLSDLATDEHAIARGSFQHVTHDTLGEFLQVALPIFHGGFGIPNVGTPAPRLGQDAPDILGDLGISESQFLELQQTGIVI